jgi:branched-chain amino acid aminotransferase
MAYDGATRLWMNGRMLPWDKATVHVMAHALHYGSSIFEGIRSYATPDGPKIFMLTDHMQRFLNSAKIYRMPLGYDLDELVSVCKQVIVDNDLLNGAYIRPLALRGYGAIGLAPKPSHPVDVVVGAWEWGAYLGDEALEEGVDVCVSSWQRVAPNTVPALAKAGGNYLSSQLISTEARRLGFAEGIALSTDGTVSEGGGENIFLVHGGKLLTPPATASILTGITRDTVMQLANRLGLAVTEQAIPREMLYLADEVFFTGTAVEITPVRSVDRIQVGNGRRGPVTQQLQEAFFGLFKGDTQDTDGWLEGLDAPAVAATAG